MRGIDWIASTDAHKYRIYLEYVSFKYKKMQHREKYQGYGWESKPEDSYLKFKNRNDDFEYFAYLCKTRWKEDISNYFNSHIGLQDQRFESQLGLFA